MEEWKDQAIILRLGLFHEADLWLRALLRNHGLRAVFAFGGAKSKKRFCGCLDILNTIDCRITSSRNGYLDLREASLLRAPVRLRSDWRALGIVNNCLQFAQGIAIGPDSSIESFELVEDLRDLAEQGKHLSGFTPMFFRLRLASALGYAPDFAQCAVCGQEMDSPGLFLANEGRLICEKCSASRSHEDKKHGFWLEAETARFLDRARWQFPTQWNLDAAPSALLRQGARAIDGFLQFHL